MELLTRYTLNIPGRFNSGIPTIVNWQEARMARNNRVPVPDYPFYEFLEHFEEAHRFGERARAEGEEVDQMAIMLRMLEYMRPRYSREEAAYKAAKFTIVMDYLASHMDDWDISDYGVTGSNASGSLIGEHVLRAVHQVYLTDAEGRHRVEEPSPERILHLARQFRDA